MLELPPGLLIVLLPALLGVWYAGWRAGWNAHVAYVEEQAIAKAHETAERERV